MRDSMIIHPEELSKAWIDRLADADIGVIGIHPHGGGEATESLKNLLELLQTDEYRKLIDYAHSRGLDVEYEIHAAGYLMPRELFEAHPEYFRMNGKGERTKDWNFCVSNPEALELVAKNAAELALSLYGSSPEFYFRLDDGGHDVYCSCPECVKLSPSDQQMLVLNRILKKIREYVPEARMAYLAFMETVVPPTHVCPEEGIFLEYAPFEKYTAKGKNSAELIQREKEMIAPLMRFFEKEPKKVLEYWYDNSLFSRWKKPPVKFVLDGEAMRRDIAECRSQGFDCISTFACFLGKDYEELHGDVDITPFAECVLDPHTPS